MNIDTKTAEAHAGGTVALAKIFGVSHNAVSMWGEHLPEARSYELRVKKPEWFTKTGTIRAVVKPKSS